jgi:prepilin-type N-terminal cleavage/methylation domain-containing protein
MHRRESPESRPDRGFTVIELLVVVLIIALLSAIAIPMFSTAMRQTRSKTLAAEVKHIYDALMQYHADYGYFPSEDSFDEETLNPLSTQGYFNGADALMEKLDQNKVLVYLAPDVGGADQHFILVTRHAADPDIVVVAVHTDIIAATEGWVDGVYIITAGELAQADDDLT